MLRLLKANLFGLAITVLYRYGMKLRGAVIALTKKVKTMNKIDIAKFSVQAKASVKAAIESDVKNFDKLQKAAIEALVTCVHPDMGNSEPLNELYEGITKASTHGVRIFLLAINGKFGTAYDTEDGETKVAPVVTFNRTSSKFELAKGGNSEQRHKAIQTARKAVVAAYEKGELTLIAWEQESRSNSANREFNKEGFIQRTIKNLIRQGLVDLAHTWNKDAGTWGLSQSDFNEAVKASDVSSQIAATEKKLNALKAKAKNSNPVPALAGKEAA